MPVHIVPPVPDGCEVPSFAQLPCSPPLPRTAEPAIAVRLPAVVQADTMAELADMVLPCFVAVRIARTSTAAFPPILVRLLRGPGLDVTEVALDGPLDEWEPDPSAAPPPVPISPILRTVWRSVDLAKAWRPGVGHHRLAFRCDTLETAPVTLDVRVAELL